MRSELKIDISDIPDVPDRIIKAGGCQTSTALYEYVYFNQPPGHILKITKKPDGVFKTVIEARGELFDVISSDKLVNPEVEITRLTNDFGIKRQLKNMRTFFELDGNIMSVNELGQRRCILIVESDNPTLDNVAKIGLKDRKILAESFDQL